MNVRLDRLRRAASGHWRRRVATSALAALVLVAGVPVANAAEAGAGGFPLPDVAAWFTGSHTVTWHGLPQQDGGTAAGKGHQVQADATRSGGGNGRAPGVGAGQLPPFALHAKNARTSTAGAGAGDGSHSFDARTSKRIAGQASATSDLYQNADGTYTRKVYSAPTNYKNAAGAWTPIDTTLAAGGDGRLHEKANGRTVDFAASADDTALASVGFDGSHAVSYGLQGAAKVSPKVSGATATYAGVLPDTDLTLSSLADGVKESIVLHSASAPTSWVFPLRTTSLTPRLAADGSVEFADAAGVVVGRVPHGFMQDASVDPRNGGHARSDAVTYQLTTVDGAPALRMSVDAAWLADPARVFPVTVDPTFTASGTTEVLSDLSGDFSSYYDMDAGTWNSGGEVGKALMAFSGLGSSLAGNRITSASLSVFDYWASSCTAFAFDVDPITQGWSVSGSKSWPGPSTGGSLGSVTANPGSACTNTAGDDTVGTWMTVGLSTGTFNSWTSGGADNGLAITASSSDSRSWKRFDTDNSPNKPYLTLNYTPDVAPQIDAQYPPNNYNAPTLTPELLAGGHDPDTWPNPAIQYDFTVYSSTGSTIIDSGKTSANSFSVPAGKLSWSQTYYWTVQAWDGWTYSTSTSPNYFTTTVPQPLITSTLAQNGDGHGFDPSIGNYTTEVTDASVHTVGPALSVVRDYNSLDPRVAGAFGAGWSTTFDMKATEVRDANSTLTSLIITYPNGQEVGFGTNGDGTFTPPSGRFATLTSITGGYKLVDKTGTTYTFTQATGGGVYGISSIVDYAGRDLTFAYNANGQIVTATSGKSQRALHLSWSQPSGAQSAHVSSAATDPAQPGNPASAETWTYSYNGDQLAAVCPPTSATACTTYSYTADSHYPTTVMDAGPYSYWRLGEASGATTAASEVLANEGNDASTYGNVTLGQPGPLSGSTATSAAFDGSSSYLTLKNGLVQNSTYLAVSMWFSTTGNGVLFSTDHDTANAANPGSGAMPVLYVGTDGKLYGHYWNGSVPGLVSPGTVNDGAWHHVVLSGAGNTQTLYLDGQPAGPPATGQLSNVDPYDIVGAGVLSTTAWAATPSRSANMWWHFNGRISDVAFYNHPLTASVVAQQYANGHSGAAVLATVTAPSGDKVAQVAYDAVHDRVAQVTDNNGGVWKLNAPVVTGSSQVYRGAVLGSAPTDYYRLGDAGGTQPVNEVHGGTGTYGNVTFGVAGPFAATDETATGFNGSTSNVQLPSGLFPAASSQEVWFNTSSTGGVLLSSQSAALGGGGSAAPTLWIGSDGKLRGLSPDQTLTGPFVSGLPGKCIDDSGGSDANGTHVQLWDCLPTSNRSSVNQSWTVFADGTIRNFGKCLDIYQGNTADGTLVELWDCNGGPGQKWTVTAGGALKNPASGRCLDDPNSTTTNGTQLQIWDCNGQPNQTWIQSVGATRTGPFTAGIAGKCLDDSSGGIANGTHAQLWDCVGNTNQSWTLNPDGTIRDFGKCLDISGAGTANGTLVQLWDCNGGGGQVWQATSTGALKNPASGRCLDDPNSATTNGTQLRIWDCNGSGAQQWVQSLASATTVNDGKWHHAVLTGSGVNQTLYLDGVQAATTVGTVNLQPGTSQYAYLGAGDTGTAAAFLAPGTTAHFSGSLEEAAFYPSALASADVARHWAAYKSALGSPAPMETVQVTDPGSHPSTYAYDPANGDRALWNTDPTGGKTSYGYDSSGFQDTVTDPDGDVTTTGHDIRGNVVSQTTCQNQPANVCSTVYHTYFPDDTTASPPLDARNDLVLTTRDGRSASATDNTYLTSFTYDTGGNQTTTTTPPVPGFPAGRTTTSVYTDGTASFPAADTGNAPAGLLASSTTPGGAKVTMTYFHDGDPATMVDPAGEATAFSYDALGRIVSKTVTSDSYPNGLTTAYAYDGLNRTVTKTDPARTDRVTGAVHTPQTTTVFDADGNVTAATVTDTTGGDAPRTTTNTYDTSDRLATSTDAAGKTTTYGYDAYGNTRSETDPAGTETDYAYDALGHLLTTTLIGYTGDPANPSPPTNLVENSRAYDPAGRLATTTDSMGWVTAYTYTDNGLTATVARQDPAHSQSFVQEADTYDAAGNLVKKVTNNGTTTSTFTVDAAGRITASTLDPSGVDRTTNTVYSPDDYVLTTTQTDPTGAIAATDYTYDPLGRKTSQTVHNDTAGHPVGWWKLADGSGTAAVDSSGTGQTATLSAGGVTWASGAATFTGSGAVTTAAPAVNTTGSFSVSAWVDLTTADTNWQDVLSQDGGQTSNFELLYAGPNSKHWEFSRATADVANRSTVSVDSSAAATAGTWTHIVGVYDATASTITLYVNGVSQGSTAAGSASWPANGPTAIGRGWYNGAASNRLNGSVSDVQVYNRVLNPTDVGTLYGDGRTGGALNASPLTTTWHLDQRGLPTAMTDAAGSTTTYAFDEAGRQAVTTQPAVPVETDGGTPVLAHPVSSVGYDTFGEAVESADPNGNVTITAYDAGGRATATTLPPYTQPGATAPITSTTSRAYNSVGEVASATDALGKTTSYTYDQLGDVATVTQPGGGTAHYTYDTDGDQLSATDPAGAQTQATYDYLGHVLTSTQLVRQPSPAAYTTTSAYTDAAGFLSATTTPTGVATSYTYDHTGQVTKVVDGAGNATTYGYDFLGRSATVTAADGTSSTAAYDQAGRPVSQTDRDSLGNVVRTTSAAYDAAGNPVSTTDALGHTTTLAYDATGTVLSEVQPVAAGTSITTTFGYDAAGNRTRFTDGRGNAFIATYTSWNLPESTIEPATPAFPDAADRTFTTAYDAAGRAATQTSPGGVVVTDSYDDLGHLTGQTGTGADAATVAHSFGYDASGRMTSAAAPGGTDTFAYDDRGLLLSTAGPSGSSSFAYNSAGQMTGRSDAAGTSAYGYDTAGRLSTVADASTGATLTFGYNNLSLPTSISYGASADSRSYGYDSLHRLASDTLKNSGGTPIASITYGYDANSNETSKTTTGVAGASTNTYTYDWANRLASWNNGTTTIGYAYDASGNRTRSGSATFAYDARNELSSDGANTYTYTARGTQASTTPNGQSAIASTSDAFNRVITQGGQTYTYDSLDRVVTAGGRGFAYSGMRNDAASDGAATYSRGPSGGLVGVKQGTTSALTMTDAHTDVVAEFAPASGTLTASATYDPFGNVTAGTGLLGNLGYQSAWTDASTGKVNMAARWYNPATGQFTSRDTLGLNPVPNPVSADRFAYVNDNPLTGGDPTGHCDWWNPFCGGLQQTFNNVVKPALATAYNASTQFLSGFAAGTVSTLQSMGTAALNLGRNILNTAVTIGSNVGKCVSNLGACAVHVATTISNTINDVRNNIVNGVQTVWHAAQYTVTHPVQAMQYAAHAATTFVKAHAADIVSFVASTAVFMGCEAALGVTTFGVGAVAGAVACGALSGAVASAVNYGMKTPMNKWNAADFGKAVAGGAVGGAVGGLFGSLGGELMSSLGSKLLGPALDAVAERLGPAAMDDSISTATDDAVSSVTDDATSSAANDATHAGEPSGSGTGSEPSATGSSEPTSGSSEPGSSGGDEPSSDGGTCSHSFAPDTEVLMADGTTEKIADVKLGDKVASTDPSGGKTTAEPVVVLHDNHDTDLADVTVQTAHGQTTTLHTTSTHPFWNATTHQWTKAADLKPGTALYESNGDDHTVKVVSVKTWTGLHDMHDLTVADLHTYYVLAGETSVLVHNCNDLVGDEQKFPTQAHTISDHVSPSSNALEGLVKKKGINTVWNNLSDAQAALDQTLKRITQGGQKSQLLKWFAKDSTSNGSQWVLTGWLEGEGDSLGTAWTLDDAGNLVSQPLSGRNFTVVLQRMKGHPQGFIPYTVYPTP